MEKTKIVPFRRQHSQQRIIREARFSHSCRFRMTEVIAELDRPWEKDHLNSARLLSFCCTFCSSSPSLLCHSSQQGYTTSRPRFPPSPKQSPYFSKSHTPNPSHPPTNLPRRPLTLQLLLRSTVILGRVNTMLVVVDEIEPRHDVQKRPGVSRLPASDSLHVLCESGLAVQWQAGFDAVRHLAHVFCYFAAVFGEAVEAVCQHVVSRCSVYKLFYPLTLLICAAGKELGLC